MDSRSRLQEDIQAVRERDPAARTSLEVFLTSPGLFALSWHRVAHWLWTWEWFLLARIVSGLSRWFTGIEIHPAQHWVAGLSSTTAWVSSLAKPQWWEMTA